MRKLKFGGPELPNDATTFYRHVNPDGQFAGLVNVAPGDTVDEARVMDAQSYVDRKMAVWVEPAITKPKQAAAAATEE